jgi:hypothetical protein
MFSSVATTMSPEDMIFTFNQKDEESFKEAWSRIYDWHGKTEPKMTLSLLLSCFTLDLLSVIDMLWMLLQKEIFFIVMEIKPSIL